jgi:hypothetical protein
VPSVIEEHDVGTPFTHAPFTPPAVTLPPSQGSVQKGGDPGAQTWPLEQSAADWHGPASASPVLLPLVAPKHPAVAQAMETRTSAGINARRQRNIAPRVDQRSVAPSTGRRFVNCSSSP